MTRSISSSASRCASVRHGPAATERNSRSRSANELQSVEGVHHEQRGRRQHEPRGEVLVAEQPQRVRRRGVDSPQQRS